MDISYQDLFRSLKGGSLPCMSKFVLPIAATEYGLSPICCESGAIDEQIVEMLTAARNRNADSFLTYFTATNDRTRSWLASAVATDSSRILFVVKHLLTHNLYGYMGLAYGNSEATYIEADAIVRYSETPTPNLMKRAFVALTRWVTFDLGIKNIWIRVLADNPAIKFYEKCGFVRMFDRDLYIVLNEQQELVELRETQDGQQLARSPRKLTYMTLRE